MIFRYSALDASYRCLQKYKYVYIDKLSHPTNSADLRFGTAIHSALRVLFETDKSLGEIDPTELFLHNWALAKNEFLVYTRCNWKTLEECGVTFIRKFVNYHYKHYKPLYIEQNLEFFVGNHRFHGTVDFIGHYKGELSIVDFKTSAYPYTKEKIQSNEQLYIYAHAVIQQLNLKPTQLVYPVFVKNRECRIQTEIIKLTSDKLKSMISNVEKQCDLLVSLQNFPKNRNSCMIGTKRCEFWDKCYGGEDGREKESTKGTKSRVSSKRLNSSRRGAKS